MAKETQRLSGDFDAPAPPKERHLYRAGSLTSSHASFAGEDGVQLRSIPSATRSIGSRTNISTRSRTPSGKSIKSRSATRAEYHEDLKQELQTRLTCHLLFLSFIIVMGTSFLFGYNIGVLNQPVELIQEFYRKTYSDRCCATSNSSQSSMQSSNTSSETEKIVPAAVEEWTITFLWSLTTTLFVCGGMVGAFTAGFIADRFGRKKACLISCAPALVGAILCTICVVTKSPELLMLGRLITGINCGLATQLAPMYLLEIAPFNLKGAFGTANQLFVTVGIFFGSVLGLREILGTATLWPLLLLFNGVPAVLMLVCLPFLPDSPRYLLLIKKNKTEAEKALEWIRQTSDVVADMEEMETEMADTGDENSKKQENYTMMKFLQSKELRMPLLIAVMLQIIQQLSGINAIFFYSTGIYKNAGVDVMAIQYAVLGTNAVNVIMTIIAVPIMDKAGHRPLLLFPMVAMIFILGLITMALKLQAEHQWMSYISIGCVIGYVICFAVGLGPIPMMIAAELFRQEPRPRAMSIAGLTNWLFTAIVALSFEMIQAVTKEYTFLIFLVFMIGFTLFVFFLVPETKNKTFEEIASQFQPGEPIEVEEFVDDPLYTGDNEANNEVVPTESSKLMMEVKDGIGDASKGDKEDNVFV